MTDVVFSVAKVSPIKPTENFAVDDMSLRVADVPDVVLVVDVLSLSVSDLGQAINDFSLRLAYLGLADLGLGPEDFRCRFCYKATGT